MWKLAVGLVAAVLLAGLALVILGLTLNRTIAANREAILARAQAALGRPLQVAEISVSWSAGLGVRLTQVDVGEDPDFDREPFVRAPEVTVYLKLGPLLARRFEIGSVTLTAPIVRVVRAADGRRNYERLGSKVDGFGGATPAAQAAAAVDTIALAWQIDSVTVRDGTLIAVDRSISPPSGTTLRQIDLTLRDVSRERPVTFDLVVAVAGDRQNVHLTGYVGPVGQSGRMPVRAHGTLGPFPDLRATIEDLDVQAVLTPRAGELEHLRGQALAGRFDLSGSCGWEVGDPLHLAGEFRQISLAQLLALRSERPAMAIDGTGTLRLDLHGRVGPDPLRTLAGMVNVGVTGGTLRQFNVTKELLERVAGLPGLSRMLSGHVKPKYGRLLTAADTRFEQAAATLQVANGRATTDDLTLTGEEFGIRAAGWFDIDTHVDMTGSLVMSKRFSDDLTADVKEVKYAVDDHGQLAVPFRLQGSAGALRPQADLDALTRMLERALSRGAAADLLGKLLGGKRRRETTPQPRDADPLQRKRYDLFGR